MPGDLSRRCHCRLLPALGPACVFRGRARVLHTRSRPLPVPESGSPRSRCRQGPAGSDTARGRPWGGMHPAWGQLEPHPEGGPRSSLGQERMKPESKGGGVPEGIWDGMRGVMLRKVPLRWGEEMMEACRAPHPRPGHGCPLRPWSCQAGWGLGQGRLRGREPLTLSPPTGGEQLRSLPAVRHAGLGVPAQPPPEPAARGREVHR